MNSSYSAATRPQRLTQWSKSLWPRALEALSAWLPSLPEYLRRSAAKFRDLGVEQYTKHNTAPAITYFLEALRWTPKDPALLCDLAQIYYEAGDLGSAEREFRKALKYDPSYARALKALGVVLHARGQLSEAQYFYLQYLEQNRTDVDVLFNLGAAFQDSGKYEQALRYYGRAEKLDRSNTLILENRARCLYALGKFEDAAVTLHRALELDPTNSSVQSLLAMALEAMGHDDEALSHYMAILDREPEQAAPRLEAAQLLERIGSYDQAAARALQALELCEKQHDTEGMKMACWHLGWIYYRLRDFDHSVQFSSRAVELDPKLFPARFNLALVLALLGRSEQALKEYEQGIADLSQPSDFKYYAIDDLAEALKKGDGQPEAQKVLDILQRKYKALKQTRRRGGNVNVAPA